MDFVVPPLVRAAVAGCPSAGLIQTPRYNGRTPLCPTCFFGHTTPECISLLFSLPAYTNRRLSGKAKKEVLGFLLRVSFFIYYNKLTANVKHRWPSLPPSFSGYIGRIQHP